MKVRYDYGCTYNDGTFDITTAKFRVEVTQNKFKTSCITNWIRCLLLLQLAPGSRHLSQSEKRITVM